MPLPNLRPSVKFAASLAVWLLAGLPAAWSQTELTAKTVAGARWFRFPADQVASIETSEPESKKSTEGLLEGNPQSCSLLTKLEGSRTTLHFRAPQHLQNLAVVQGGWGDWALPKDLLVTLDGQESVRVHLVEAKGQIQLVMLERAVRDMEVKVESVFGEGRRPWGGFSGLGQADLGPIVWPLTHPLQRTQEHLTLTVDAPSEVDATLSAIFQGMHFNFPPLKLRAGAHDYPVSLAKLEPAAPYGIAPQPQNFDALALSAPTGKTPIKITAVTPVEPPAPGDPWEPLPALEFPTREIDGQKWTEGLSFGTAGRFGNTAYNGLLTELVGGSWFRAYTANAAHLDRRQDFDLRIEGFPDDDTGRGDQPWQVKMPAWSAGQKARVNWTGMTLEKANPQGGFVRYYCGLLTPGFLVDSDRTVHLSSRGTGRLPLRSGAPLEEEARFNKLTPAEGAAAAQKFGPMAVLTSDGLLTAPQNIDALHEPWLVAIWGIQDGSPTFWGDEAVAVLLTGDAKEPIAWSESELALPKGRWGVSTAFHGLLGKNWRAAEVTERARLLTRFLRSYPVDCREYYTVTPETVRIRNEFTYDRWGDPAWQAPDFAPIPPAVSLARDFIAEAGIPAGEPSTVKTPYGPYRWMQGNVLEYSLRRIEARHAAFPRRAEFEQYYGQMDADLAGTFGNPPFETVWTDPWLLGYFKTWTQGLLGGSYVQTASRQKLLEAARPIVQRMYASSVWLRRDERFSGAPYYIHGWPDMSAFPIMYGDPNSNVGQAAYSSYLYGKYSGDWELLRQLWPRIMDTMRIFEVLNDWAVPETTSREALKYGAIDMDTIAYAGLAALERSAVVLGKDQDATRLAYLRAKVGLATALRFKMPAYLDPEKKTPQLYGVGFAEDGPGLEIAAPGNPVGLDHSAMCLTWTGEMPEMYSFYAQTLTPAFLHDFEAELMDKYYPDWRTMPFNQVRSAAHIANRAYLADWPQEGLDNDLKLWLAHIHRTTPPYEAAGMFGAFTGHETGIYLVDWEPAAFVSSTYQASERLLSVSLESVNPFLLRFAAPLKIESITLDRRRVSLEAVKSRANFHSLPLDHGGALEIRFAPPRP